ncbi:MAG TPA: secondary thiamine-phosphate synthase enzyme YjbQ [Dehalococcoidia bacterium]|nr:secondary thiamine-phosphate synthase enzyme YjbQ [Dehalococcoidia bacterium]
MQVKLEQLSVPTRGIGHFAEITREVDECVRRSGVREGIALVRSRHTTAAITCNEPDPRLHEDMRDAVYEMFPTSRRYRHIEEGAENAVAHLATAMLFGEATWLPVRAGRLDLGTWQHVYLVELYEPRRRQVDVAVLGE